MKYCYFVIGFVVMTILLFMGATYASAPLITPDEFDPGGVVAAAIAASSEEAHWFWSALSSDTARNIWLYLVSTAAALIIRWLKLEGTQREKAIRCIEQGVKDVGDIWVREMKKGRKDGKLTEKERKEANAEAISFACAYAKEQGFELAKVFAKDILPSLVDRAVRKLKGESALTKLPLQQKQSPALPDLQPSHG